MYSSHTYVSCDIYEAVPSLQPNHREHGNSNVCRNVGTASMYDMAKSSKLKLHINVAVATSSVKSLYDFVGSEHEYRVNNGTL
jgi:hypothetical protein